MAYYAISLISLDFSCFIGALVFHFASSEEYKVVHTYVELITFSIVNPVRHSGYNYFEYQVKIKNKLNGLWLEMTSNFQCWKK